MKLGALQSLTCKGVVPSGANVYQATFERGTLEWRIWIKLDGSVARFVYRAMSPPA